MERIEELSKEDILDFRNLIILKMIKGFKELYKWNKQSESMSNRVVGRIEGYKNTLKYFGGINEEQANKLILGLPSSIETERYPKRLLELDIRDINNANEVNYFISKVRSLNKKNNGLTDKKNEMINQIIHQFKNLFELDEKKEKIERDNRLICSILGMILGYEASLECLGGINESQANALRVGLKDIETVWYNGTLLELDILSLKSKE